ncbi:MAG: hypothetical protein GYA24_10505 [Candidatus Lokiarchaeota archaeon]|nr:hypothetical protein [Candidatus Lokiarchaeota archaeon]
MQRTWTYLHQRTLDVLAGGTGIPRHGGGALDTVNGTMAGFHPIKTIEYSDSVRQISCNKDERQPLIAVIVDGNRDIVLLAPDGEQKLAMSGHADPVIAFDWISNDTAASISSRGEVRAWTIKGKRVDCTCFKDRCPKPRGLVAIPSARRGDTRFVTWYQDGSIGVFDAMKPGMVSKIFPGQVLGICGVENTIITMIRDEDVTRMVLLGPDLAEKRSLVVDFPGTIVAMAGILLDGTNPGCMLLDDAGRVVSITSTDGKAHVLDKGEIVSASCMDKDTRTLFLGMKSGVIRSVAFRPDLTFIDTVDAFEAHEFKITAIELIKKPPVIAVGGLDGIVKLGRAEEAWFQKSKQSMAKPVIDLKERERVENKLRQAEDAVAKGDTTRAEELVTAARQANIADLAGRIVQVENRIREQRAVQQQAQATRHKLIDFLERVAEERGEILVAEIGKALSMPVVEVKRWIKALDAEMEWEYIEQHECLILFDRSMSIARETDIERMMSRDAMQRPRGGQRRQLGRGRQYEGRPHPPAPRRQVARPQDAPPRPDLVTDACRATGAELVSFKHVASSMSGKMQASILGPDLHVMKTMPLPDLVPALESIQSRVHAVVTDGIISPRLVTIAEKAGAKFIIGQRLHPNLDKNTTRVACIEFHELERGLVKPSPARDGGEPHGSTETRQAGSKDIETRLLAVISGTKWQSADEILASARITDEFERNLANIKLKQLVASGTLKSEVVNKILFFLQARKS